MTTRRSFIQQTSAIALAGLLPSQHLFNSFGTLDKIGIQLFSLPKMLDTDYVAAIKLLAKMGYRELEIFGPYPFSAKSAIDRWNQVTPSLGFKGSGYFGKSMQEVKSILNDNGMTSPSAHTDLDTLMNGMDKLGEAAAVLGHEYVVLPAIPEEKRKTLDDYKRLAEDFNRIGENAKKNNIRFAYHNHGYGLKPMDGQIPLNVILDNTDPALVFFEMDIYWTSAGGANPIAYLEKYPNRYRMMHIKDMKEKKYFSGDGSTFTQWIELFPYMTTAGDGVLDVASIVKKAKSTGVTHFFVEQDRVDHPEIALKRSIDFLKKI